MKDIKIFLVFTLKSLLIGLSVAFMYILFKSEYMIYKNTQDLKNNAEYLIQTNNKSYYSVFGTSKMENSCLEFINIHNNKSVNICGSFTYTKLKD